MKNRNHRFDHTAGLWAAGAGMLLAGVPAAQSEIMRAWTRPSWGFVPHAELGKIQENKIAQSLIFDQSFDRLSYRPLPKIVQMSIAQNRDNRDSAVARQVARDLYRTDSVNGGFKNLVALAQPAPVLSEALLHDVSNPSSHIDFKSFSLPELKFAMVDTSGSRKPAAQAARPPMVQALQAPVQIVAPQVHAPAAVAPQGAPVPAALSRSAVEAPAARKFIAKQSALTQAPVPSPAPAPTKAPVPTPAPLLQIPPQVAKNDTTPKLGARTAHFAAPKAERNVAKIFVLDEDSLLDGEPRTIANAEVSWVGVNSGLISTTNADGVAKSPYPATSAMRFVVKAQGYLPALGYAVGDYATPVVLMAERRLAPIIKSLGFAPDPDRVIVLGKILDRHLKPMKNVTLDASIEKPFRLFYSLGAFDLFHPTAQLTGPQGDFVISGIGRGIQYLMPTQTSTPTSHDFKEWPAMIADFSNLPSVVTVTLQDSVAASFQTQVVDAFSLERPAGVGIQATVGGQRGVFVPDAEGFIKFPELYKRPTADLIEIRAQGYYKTWITASANSKTFPDSVSLFNQRQLDTVLGSNASDVDSNKGLVLGHLRPEIFKHPVVLKVFDSRGRAHPTAKVLYFDDKNFARAQLNKTDAIMQNFAVANLEPGEWQLVAVDPKSEAGLAAQLVRVENDTISQVQF